jgi:hypothetical protein
MYFRTIAFLSATYLHMLLIFVLSSCAPDLQVVPCLFTDLVYTYKAFCVRQLELPRYRSGYHMSRIRHETQMGNAFKFILPRFLVPLAS